ncbi:MBL fold metallo-hydrolase [Cohnella rhizosphaerae]|uniref:MBL fold metallo-hydrolase n=1 Tax=Cohnella rhizosphaerae TaxID=1457232 RepID=A0A9X4KXZ2_9BACL|nr:MBL fold metallo-hydrolase [Cohnella rhizosphaerae]MDG0810022.1 MBL fold metallo-hydrolase [Cohnella rhizosphaerae]
MGALLREILEMPVGSGRIAVWSLGQAGYVYKFPSGKVALIDPYITDYCERQIGPAFKRLAPSLISPRELGQLPIAAYLVTHHHEDHLDADCVQQMQSGNFPFYAPPETIRRLNEWGVAEERCRPLLAGSVERRGEFTIFGVYADHGELAPDAIGIIVQAGDKAVYHMGDTCLREAEFRKNTAGFRIDLLLAPINGRYGNMNEAEAAAATEIVNPAYAAPCHFWMLPGNSGGDPLQFVEAVEKRAPQTTPFLFRQGEALLL